MEQMLNLWNALVDAYGDEQIRNLADEFGVDISDVGKEMPDDWAEELFVELLAFVVNDLAPMDAKKAMSVIKNAGVPEEMLEDIFG
jgi:hypothetical protein